MTEKASRSIVETMRHAAKALMPHFGNHDPEEINYERCQGYILLRRAAGKSDGTVHTELGHLATVLSWGAQRRHITHAPISRLSKPAHRDRYITRDEARALMNGASAPHIRLAIILMLGTAARVRAILDLTWDRCDFEKHMIHPRDPDDGAKRKGRAVVPMNRMARAALSEATEGALSAYVIEWAGRPVLALKKGIATAARKAGLVDVSPHVLRRTAAVWMAEGKVSMDEIAQYLGHKDSRITSRVYARFSPEYLRGAASVLDLDCMQLNQRALSK